MQITAAALCESALRGLPRKGHFAKGVFSAVRVAGKVNATAKRGCRSAARSAADCGRTVRGLVSVILPCRHFKLITNLIGKIIALSPC